VHQTTSQAVGNNIVHVGANVAGSPQSRWPTETDLFFPPGSNRLALSAQNSLISLVVQDAINNVRASLLFDYAFPEGVDKVALVRGCLLAGAEKYKPSSSHIHERLLNDSEYMALMIHLVRAILSKKLSLNLSYCSRVLGFPCSEVKPKSGVTHLSLWLLWSLHQRRSQSLFKCKLPSTISYSRCRYM
jgi:hypothetical protein